MANILIAEDEGILRRNLTYIFNRLGHTAYSARNSIDAISILERREIDVLITDMVMPEKGGGEIIEFITAHGLDVSMIIMTAYPTVDSAINAVKKGVVDYFTKPFQTEDIILAVENTLERRQGIPFSWNRLSSMGITGREMDIVQAMIEHGVTENKELADRFQLKASTIKQHLDNLYVKFLVRNRTALVAAIIKKLKG